MGVLCLPLHGHVEYVVLVIPAGATSVGRASPWDPPEDAAHRQTAVPGQDDL